MQKQQYISFNSICLGLSAFFLIGVSLSCSSLPFLSPIPTPTSTSTNTPTIMPSPSPTATNSATSTQGITIGIVFSEWDTVRPSLLRDMIRTAGYDAKVLSSHDAESERKNIEELTTQGIKVIVVSPIESYSTSTATAVDEAHAAGVTVVNYDRLICNTQNVDYYVTTDGRAVGAIWGKYLIQQAGNNKNNNLYLYAGDPSDESSFIFLDSAWETMQSKIVDGTFVIKNSKEAVALQEKPVLTHDEQARIITEVTTQWDQQVAEALAKKDLAAVQPRDKDTAYIMAPNDYTARPIADVFAADSDVKKYYIVGQDAEPASVQYIIDGKQSLTVLKDYRIAIAELAMTSISLLEGRTPKTNSFYNNGRKDVPTLQIQVVAITKENIQSVLIDTGYYQKGYFTGLP
jgi:putative multiple sugar transport system substrate-binding protein